MTSAQLYYLCACNNCNACCIYGAHKIEYIYIDIHYYIAKHHTMTPSRLYTTYHTITTQVVSWNLQACTNIRHVMCVGRAFIHFRNTITCIIDYALNAFIDWTRRSGTKMDGPPVKKQKSTVTRTFLDTTSKHIVIGHWSGNLCS